MGSIKHIIEYRHDDINDLISKYNTPVFIETGTGIGTSVDYAMRYNFDRIYSIEIHDELFNKATQKYKDVDKCIMIYGTSKEQLSKLLPSINENVFFWLDAHFPGADFGFTSFSSTADNSLRLPLESELRTICEIRDTSNDVFYIDDLRIYVDGPFTSGNWGDRLTIGGDGIKFIYELFDTTHDIILDYNNEGYIIVLPKLTHKM